MNFTKIKEFDELLSTKIKIIMTHESKINYNYSNICLYCKICTNKVRDNDHFNEKYRETACKNVIV